MARVAASTVLVLGAVLAVGGVMGLADVLDEGQAGTWLFVCSSLPSSWWRG